MIGDPLVLSSVLIAGVLSFLSPCILPLLPVYVSVLSSGSETATGGRQLTIGKVTINLWLIFKTVIFVFGLSTSFVLLGFGAGALGSLINTDGFLIVCGIVVILLGLHQTGLVSIPFLERENKLSLKRSGKRDLIGTYLLGFTFSFGWTPCIGPILGAVLGLSASEGQAAYGAFLMLVYALGMLIPFLLLAVFSDVLLRQTKKLNRHLRTIRITGGVIIVIMGIFLMTNQLNFFTTLIPQ
ncbi:cytochrome c biogenesis protein CcdA [Aciduricibacillus chroicocephali]|uniref:Cytochrome c biogenesis protein CcdA n=1 Tax=Aciduricibacillus chroicocephali TaxID=3054939 RepID=A0ABY9KVL9_9BACI|nr:cytochrome c biogenesis protein CcdA [Bacillaceae bacterium 44XB]